MKPTRKRTGYDSDLPLGWRWVRVNESLKKGDESRCARTGIWREFFHPAAVAGTPKTYRRRCR